MKVLVTGGRSYQGSALEELLTSLHAQRPFTLVIEGGSTGADSIARRWAQANRIPLRTLYADWDSGHAQAGMRRNEEMLLGFHPDLVIAAPGKAGTLDCVSKARALGIPVLEMCA